MKVISAILYIGFLGINSALMANTCPSFNTLYNSQTKIWMQSYDGWNLLNGDLEQEDDLFGFKKVTSQLIGQDEFKLSCYYDGISTSSSIMESKVYSKAAQLVGGINTQGANWKSVDGVLVCKPLAGSVDESSCSWT
jgi:hypothetical protein